MPVINYLQSNGQSFKVDVHLGSSVMQGAVDNMIEGLAAECGGACSCATCHVYVDAGWLAKLEQREDMEEGTLECAWQPRDNSRLSCQIHVTPDLEGLVVSVPQQQGAEYCSLAPASQTSPSRFHLSPADVSNRPSRGRKLPRLS